MSAVKSEPGRLWLHSGAQLRSDWRSETFRAMRKALAYQGRRARSHAPDEVATARYHVALVDPLRTRFEALNLLLATTGSIPSDKEQTTATEYGSRSCGLRLVLVAAGMV